MNLQVKNNHIQQDLKTVSINTTHQQTHTQKMDQVVTYMIMELENGQVLLQDNGWVLHKVILMKM